MARNLDPAQLLVGARLSKYSNNALTVTGSVNAHAEELRRYFVAHDGQVELGVAVNPGGVDYTSITREFVRLIHKMVHPLSFTPLRSC